MRKKCIAGGILILLLCAFFALSISAQTPIQISAADWWNAQTGTCSLFCYSSSGALLNTAVPVNPSSFISRIYDIKPYVPWTSVTSGYISSRFAYIESTFTPLPNSSSMYGLQFQFSDEWILLGGRTYEFVILRDYIAFYDDAGVATSTGTQLKTVSLGGLAMTIEDYYIGKDGFDRAIRCTVTPESNTKVQTISIVFKSSYNPTKPASKIVCRVGFSSVVAYTGSLQDVTVNPTLNNVDKQVSEINDKVGKIVDGEYQKPTPESIDDGLSDDFTSASEGSKSTLDKLSEFLSSLPAAAAHFWKNLITQIAEFQIFAPFFVCGCGFCVLRIILGR